MSQEQQRQKRWHDVYMTVLKAQMPVSVNYQANIFGGNVTVLDVDGAHSRAKSIADKAYPVPLTPEPLPLVEDLDGLGLSVRVHNALTLAGITSRAQIFAMSDWELLRLRGMGRKALKEIRKAMAPPP